MERRDANTLELVSKQGGDPAEPPVHNSAEKHGSAGASPYQSQVLKCVLVKYWFSITDEEQRFRFYCRIHNPLKQWKLSPMDLESRRRWEEYTIAKETMFRRTHISEAPGWIIEADDKKRARLNFMHQLLEQIRYRGILAWNCRRHR